MIPTIDIRNRLKASVPAFTTVSGAASIQAAIQRQQFDGQAYVLVLNKKPAENKLVNAVSQMTTATISVMYWSTDVSDSTGEATSDANEDIVDAIALALLNWSPSETYSNFEYAGGRLVQFTDSAALYAEEFTTQFLVRKTS